MTLRKIEGVANVRKVAMFDSDSQRQNVEVIDAGQFVRLSLTGCSYPAELTPEEARHIGDALIAAAQRAAGQTTQPAAPSRKKAR